MNGAFQGAVARLDPAAGRRGESDQLEAAVVSPLHGRADAAAPSGGSAVGAGWLAAALDEIDYGMLLIGRGGAVLVANSAAYAELDDEHPLQLAGGELRARREADAADLRAAIAAAACRGLRKLLNMRLMHGSGTVSTSVVPLRDAAAGAQPVALVILGRRRLGGVLAIEAFARACGLSPGEVRVLLALVEGLDPAELAARHGVAMSTVRTQIGSIRAKTGAASIRELLTQVAALPPLLDVLRRERRLPVHPAEPLPSCGLS